MSESAELLSAVQEIRELIRLMAEPAVAQRDQKLRGEIKRLVGTSVPKSKAVLLMDGTRTQRDIHRETGINEGNLSTLVKELRKSGLLAEDVNPTLLIKIPSNFFDTPV
jgi:DNA-binding MarR family transcriptional regulator